MSSRVGPHGLGSRIEPCGDIFGPEPQVLANRDGWRADPLVAPGIDGLEGDLEEIRELLHGQQTRKGTPGSPPAPAWLRLARS
jgi:hypothetical protein